MQDLRCDICNSNLTVISNGVISCSGCNMQYTKERVKEMLNEQHPNENINTNKIKNEESVNKNSNINFNESILEQIDKLILLGKIEEAEILLDDYCLTNPYNHEIPFAKANILVSKAEFNDIPLIFKLYTYEKKPNCEKHLNRRQHESYINNFISQLLDVTQDNFLKDLSVDNLKKILFVVKTILDETKEFIENDYKIEFDNNDAYLYLYDSVHKLWENVLLSYYQENDSFITRDKWVQFINGTIIAIKLLHENVIYANTEQKIETYKTIEFISTEAIESKYYQQVYRNNASEWVVAGQLNDEKRLLFNNYRIKAIHERNNLVKEQEKVFDKQLKLDKKNEINNYWNNNPNEYETYTKQKLEVEEHLSKLELEYNKYLNELGIIQLKNSLHLVKEKYNNNSIKFSEKIKLKNQIWQIEDRLANLENRYSPKLKEYRNKIRSTKQKYQELNAIVRKETLPKGA